MIVRSKAPLRLGLAGGGTDVSPYSEQYGGSVLNVTIDMFAYCTIETNNLNMIEFHAKDVGLSFKKKACRQFALKGDLILHKAIYNRIVRDFNGGQPLPVKITTFSDAPPGSGLGSSSTMVVAILNAYRELLALPLGEYDVAHLAFIIERIDCQLAGGKQDQYATTFGGFNFMEFYSNDKVIVNPLRIRRHIENELHSNIILYFTGVSRDSAKIIEEQIRTTNTKKGAGTALEAMHEMKRLAFQMKENLLKGDIDNVISCVSSSWNAKKNLASIISNNYIDKIAQTVLASGARAVKISGAGGGGFMMIFADPTLRIDITRCLSGFDGFIQRFNFTHSGAESWRV